VEQIGCPTYKKNKILFEPQFVQDIEKAEPVQGKFFISVNGKGVNQTIKYRFRGVMGDKIDGIIVAKELERPFDIPVEGDINFQISFYFPLILSVISKEIRSLEMEWRLI